jgi:hypothetical protein
MARAVDVTSNQRADDAALACRPSSSLGLAAGLALAGRRGRGAEAKASFGNSSTAPYQDVRHGIPPFMLLERNAV